MSRIAVADRLSEQQVEANESATAENAGPQVAISRPSVAEVAMQIAADSHIAPKQYLDETVQPLGGE